LNYLELLNSKFKLISEQRKTRKQTTTNTKLENLK